jgi:hypothetical protein
MPIVATVGKQAARMGTWRRTGAAGERLWDLAVGTPTGWSVGSSLPSSAGAAPQDGTSETWTAQNGTLTP